MKESIASAWRMSNLIASIVLHCLGREVGIELDRSAKGNDDGRQSYNYGR